ncbi:ricin-type beta-trefoil lectin domain protein [Streptomyces sp. NPDC002580]|uniref:ricin-type beta-trefoil lectin domain protein n=1 Tax=Streptomyces sp. NPDC002580 TaxID=3364653 RepID=UPI0036B3EB13
MPDARLAAELKKSPGGTPANYPVGELLDRHWEAVFSYARLCTDGVRPAGMLTTASFTRLFGDSLHQSGPSAAWRPQLLVTVRRIAAEWLNDQRRALLDPELLAEADREDRAAARLLPVEGRRLLSRAFARLPEQARCLLWHVTIEAERLDVPAALLGLPHEDAVIELERAGERLREACLEIHRELAPGDECRRYHRMLDVSFRRGGNDLDPDLRRHMDRCGHCRDAADQLNQFNGDLAVPLAEAVLGWGAHAYVASRRARAATRAGTDTEPGSRASTDGEAFASAAATADSDPFVEYRPEDGDARPPGLPRSTPPTAPADTEAAPAAHDPAASPPAAPAPRGTAVSGTGERPSRRRAPSSGTGRRASRRGVPHKAPRRAAYRRNVALAVLTVGALIVVPLVLWAADMGSGGDGATDAGSSVKPSHGTNPSWVGTDKQADGSVRGRLRNAASGLCVGTAGDKPAKGVEARLTACASESALQWSYAADGLLRDAAHPDLCLDSRLGYSVQLASCPGTSQPDAKYVRYDFTLQGMLVPRWNQELALTPAAAKGESALVLKVRKDQPTQHWTLDTTSPSLQLEVVNWGSSGGDTTAEASPEPPGSSTEPASGTPGTSATTPAAPVRTTAPAAPTDGSCSYDYSCQRGGRDGSYGDGWYGFGADGSGSVGGGGRGGRR